MFCPQCGKKANDGAKFCPSCGANLSGKTTKKQTSTSSGFSIGKILGLVVLFIILIVVLVVVFTMIFFVSSSSKKSTSDPPAVQQEQQAESGQKSKQETANDKKLHKKKFEDGTEVVYGVVSNVGIFVANAAEINNPVGNKYISERPQGKFIGVAVFVENHQNDAITVMGGSYALIDEKGREYTTSTPAMTAWEMSHHGQNMLTEINPGNASDFVLIFDVPRDAELKNFRLRAQAGMTGDSVVLPFNYDPRYPLE